MTPVILPSRLEPCLYRHTPCKAATRAYPPGSRQHTLLLGPMKKQFAQGLRELRAQGTVDARAEACTLERERREIQRCGLKRAYDPSSEEYRDLMLMTIKDFNHHRRKHPIASEELDLIRRERRWLKNAAASRTYRSKHTR